ncbi:MAG: hypothetical protein E6R08_06440 [Nevskiaceae bacterium]|nr:MAG: hypothetical protein E6R08_06440 [Nevskiaceae bacterium]
MMLEMPIEAVPAQVFAVQWGDFKARLDIQWNDRGQYFTATIYNDNTDEMIAAGLVLCLGVDLLSPYNFELGSLLMVDTSNTGTEATVDNFGDQVKLYWFSEDEKNGLQ